MRIDPHVHFRDEEQSYKETIKHGLLVATEQEVDIVFDMPNTAKPILTTNDVKRRLSFVPKKDKKRYFLYLGATVSERQLKEAIALVKNKREVIGIKMFAGRSTGDLAIVTEADQRKIYSILTKNNYQGVLAVHCEKEKFIKDIFNFSHPYSHSLARPKKAEIESVKDQIKFAREFNFQGNLHICHITCLEAVRLVEKARTKIKITCAVTPHHLFWDNSMLKRQNGLLYKTNPPLRNKREVAGLRRLLKQGKIDWIETDHAPHAIGEKLYQDYHSGYPSLYLYKKCVKELLPQLGLTKKQIDDLTFNNIIKIFERIF